MNLNGPPLDIALCKRFRGYLPVIIDVETGGFNPQTDALLEIAAVTINMNDQGLLVIDSSLRFHIEPFPGSHLDPAALEFNKIDPHHPLRDAIKEEDALANIFKLVRQKIKDNECQRAILTGHNPGFDLAFLNAAVERCNIKRNPFHPFSCLDTASLSALAVGQTVLAKAVQAANIPFDHKQAHSALYDAERTAELFCAIVNKWQHLGGWNTTSNQSIFTQDLKHENPLD